MARWYRERRGHVDQLTVSQTARARGVHNSATLCLTTVSVHGPLLGGGRNQHAPSDGARLPQWDPDRADGRRQAGRLTLQNRVRIQSVIGRSALEPDLIEAEWELFGNHDRHAG